MKKIKNGKVILMVIVSLFIAAGYFFFQFINNQKFQPPQEFKLEVTHVSDLDESLKFSDKRVGGHCYLASTTMMLKSFDPSIEFWQVVIARGNATSFTYYFPQGNESEIKEGLGGDGTAMALRAISNMGYQPHIRLRALPINNNRWITLAKELGGDAQTYWLSPPMTEYKTVIASGIPLVAAGSPCWQDFNVIEGYTSDKLLAVAPNPDDQHQTNPKISCAIGSGLQHEIFWATPQSKQIQHSAILADMKSYAQTAPEKMFMYANYLQKDSSVVNFEIERLYLARLLAVKYLQERGYPELAAGYQKSTLLFRKLTEFVPSDANKHRELIAQTIREIAENEQAMLSKWEAVK